MQSAEEISGISDRYRGLLRNVLIIADEARRFILPVSYMRRVNESAIVSAGAK